MRAELNQLVTDYKGKLTPLMQAVMNNDINAIHLANKETIDAQDNNGKTALMYAVEKGNKEALEALLEKGANPNIADKDNNTPLLYLTMLVEPNALSADMAKLLINHNAKVNAQNDKGYTPLIWAIIFTYLYPELFLPVVQDLLKAGADPAIRNKDGHDALYYISQEQEKKGRGTGTIGAEKAAKVRAELNQLVTKPQDNAKLIS